MLKKLFNVLFILFVFISIIHVSFGDKSDFEIDITPPRIVIYEDEVAEYNLTIKNNNDFDERFQNPYASDPDWVITTDPEIDVVPAKRNMEFKLLVRPKTEVIPGQYGITLNINSLLTDEQRKDDFLIFIKPLTPLPVEYVKSIALNVDVDSNIDSRKDIPFSVYLRNRNARSYDNLRIEIRSNLINKEYYLNFSAVEERTDRFSFKLNEYTPPQEDKITVTIYSDNEVINQIKIPIKIIKYSEVKEDLNIEDAFLKTTTTITLTNFGNVENDNPYKYELSFLKDLFTKTKPLNTKVVKSDKRYIEFPTYLLPGKTVEYTITTDYRFFVYALIFVIIVIITYYQLRTPVIAKKEAYPHEQSPNGVSDFKVKILVKNRSQKPVENVKVVEMIPSLATLVKETNIGTIKPSKITVNEKAGTLVRWDIDYLEPFEERIITYKLRSELNIVGGLTLQPTKVKFEMITGKERVTYSKKHNIKLLH